MTRDSGDMNRENEIVNRVSKGGWVSACRNFVMKDKIGTES